MGPNEYGCADAANILYMLGDMPRDMEVRKARIKALQEFQNPDTGLFWEGTHHTLHCTAHCTAALELFDALPEKVWGVYWMVWIGSMPHGPRHIREQAFMPR